MKNLPSHELIECFFNHLCRDGGLSRQYSYTMSLLLSSDFRHKCNDYCIADIVYG